MTSRSLSVLGLLASSLVLVGCPDGGLDCGSGSVASAAVRGPNFEESLRIRLVDGGDTVAVATSVELVAEHVSGPWLKGADDHEGSFLTEDVTERVRWTSDAPGAGFAEKNRLVTFDRCGAARVSATLEALKSDPLALQVREGLRLVGPVDGARVRRDELTLSWIEASDAISYELQVARTDGSTAAVRFDRKSLGRDARPLLSCELTAEHSPARVPEAAVLPRGEEVFWRARPLTRRGAGAWSGPGRFVLASECSPPRLERPLEGETGPSYSSMKAQSWTTMRYSWSTVPGAVGYEFLLLSGDGPLDGPRPTDVVARRTTLPDSWELETSSDYYSSGPGIYRWTVRACTDAERRTSTPWAPLRRVRIPTD